MSTAALPLSEAADALDASATDRATLRTETLAGSVMMLLALTIVQRGIGFVRGILFCRWLEPEELGQWDMAFGFLTMAAPIAVLGITGSFGRYLEYYRHRGQARAFLRRACLVILLLGCAAAGLVAMAREEFSQLVFGRSDRGDLVLLAAGSLLALVAFNLLNEVFGGLRVFRFASAMQFAHSLAFAVLGIVLILAWRPDVSSVLWAFCGACALSVLGCGPWLRRTWRELPLETGERLSGMSLCKKIAPFAASVWITNWLWNLFEIADRYILLHYSGLDNAAALAELGNYHSARALPLPLFAVASLLAGAMLPHLSHDWECGRREQVGRRVNLMLKLAGLAMLAAAVGLQLIAPWVFHTAFENKLNGGLAIFPLTLVCFVWTGLCTIACCYLWCAEKAAWTSVAMFFGLLLSCGLNLLLVPRLGLFGAVLGTSLAKLAVLTLLLWFSARQGMALSRPTCLVALAALSLAAGPAVSATVLLALFHQAQAREWLLDADEKRRFADAWRKYTARFRQRRTAA